MRFRRSRNRHLAVTDDRARLLELLPRHSVGCEIGVWKGDFSARLLESVCPRELHLVDPWLFAGEARYAAAWYGGALARSQADMDRIYEGVRERFQSQIAQGTVLLHRGSSQSAVSMFPDGYFDWVYIDGNHLYDHVRADLAAFAPKVKRGALITGDDYRNPGWWDDGVRRAVDEFIDRGDVEVVSLADQFILKCR